MTAFNTTPATGLNRLFASATQRAAALGLATATTLAVLASVVQLADGYLGQAELAAAQAASQPQAEATQQVLIVGRRSPRG